MVYERLIEDYMPIGDKGWDTVRVFAVSFDECLVVKDQDWRTTRVLEVALNDGVVLADGDQSSWRNTVTCLTK